MRRDEGNSACKMMRSLSWPVLERRLSENTSTQLTWNLRLTRSYLQASPSCCCNAVLKLIGRADTRPEPGLLSKTPPRRYWRAFSRSLAVMRNKFIIGSPDLTQWRIKDVGRNGCRRGPRVARSVASWVYPFD